MKKTEASQQDHGAERLDIRGAEDLTLGQETLTMSGGCGPLLVLGCPATLLPFMAGSRIHISPLHKTFCKMA